jgi:hypothetical protein
MYKPRSPGVERRAATPCASAQRRLVKPVCEPHDGSSGGRAMEHGEAAVGEERLGAEVAVDFVRCRPGQWKAFDGPVPAAVFDRGEQQLMGDAGAAVLAADEEAG